MKWTVGTKISVGFGLTLAIFLVVGIVAYRSVMRWKAGLFRKCIPCGI